MSDTPAARVADWLSVENRIRRIPQYSDRDSVTVRPLEVAPPDLRPLCQVVRTRRLNRVEQLATLYRLRAAPMFAGVWLDQPGLHSRLIAPPIIECHNDMHVIIDGLHRAYYCLEEGIRCSAALVEGILPPLPADILLWSDVKTSNEKLERCEKFQNLDETHFRPVRDYIDRADSHC